MTHNPTVIRIGERWYLYYIGAHYDGPRPSAEALLSGKAEATCRTSYATIRIGCAWADDPAGPWHRPDTPCLDIRPGHFDFTVVTHPAVCLHPDGDILAVAGDDHLVHLWDLSSERATETLRGHADWVTALAFSPDGSRLASAANDGEIRFWNLSSASSVGVLAGAGQAVTDLAWAYGGALLAAAGFSGQVDLYEMETSKLVRRLAGPGPDLRALAFSPDESLLAVGGRSGAIQVWALRAGARPGTYQAHRQRVRALRFSPDGKRLVSSGEDRRIHVRSLERDQGFDLPTRPTKVFALAFVGPDQLAAGGSDNTIRLWDLATISSIGTDARVTAVFRGNRAGPIPNWSARR
jgi:WD40 repeat protein